MKRVFVAIASVGALIAQPAEGRGQAVPITPELLEGFRFRSIGPAVTGGRIHDVEALPHDPSIIYVATASGGLWKSTNKGTTWIPIFDDQPVSTFGDLAIAPSDPDVLWAGTGEQQNRQSTSWGNGVYRSLDGGSTWEHRGLVETRHIGRMLVHPEDPEVVYVAALGNLWAPSRDRGVFKTTDGGETWENVLYVDTLTGVVDLVMDPHDPNTLYAAAYQRLRRTWGFNGGGPGSGIYKTTDAGRTWRELTDGIPPGPKGRIGLAIAATNPRALNALIQHATESGTYRSEDGGETWEKVNTRNPRPMYYSHVVIDPTKEDRVYVLATSFSKSEDGGRTFETLPTRPTYDVGVHSDFHGMWINPRNPEHFYLFGDAGLHETWDMGQTYVRINNFSIGQFYAIGVDMREPYHVYGGMQDNHSWVGPSATRRWIGIINDDWRQIGFGDGMYQQADPTSHRFVYVNSQNGNYTRIDGETGDIRNVRPYPEDADESYRFDWVSPSLVSRHDPSVLYVGGNRLFISRNRGESWQATDDLTRQIDRDTLALMGVLGSDSILSKNDGTSSFGEIVTIAESPIDSDVLWVGTDDGNVQVSQDGGATWSEVGRNVPGAPPGTYVSRVVASVSGRGTAYVTFDAHRDGDFAPYVFHTTDFGSSWHSRARGLPGGSVNVLVEHRQSPNLLFLGTEHALFISLDAGGQWTRFGANLPTTLYDDLVIHPRDNDLIVGTHGRSIWILDDLTPLVEWSSDVAAAPVHLFGTRTATIFQTWKSTSYRGQGAYAGENPPHGALITYFLKSDADSVTLRVTNRRGETVRTLLGPSTAGIHRITWDLRHEPPPPVGSGEPTNALPKLPHPVTPQGPFVAPGDYTIALEAGGTAASQTVAVRGDPMMSIAQEEWEARERFLVALLDLQRRAREAEQRAGRLQSQVVERRDSVAQSGGDVLDELAAAADSARSVERRLRDLRRDLYQLAGQFNGNGVRQGSLYPPTKTQERRHRQLTEALDKALAVLSRATRLR